DLGAPIAGRQSRRRAQRWSCTASSVALAEGLPRPVRFPRPRPAPVNAARRSVGAGSLRTAIELAPWTISIWPASPAVPPLPPTHGPLRPQQSWLSGCSRLGCTAVEEFRLAPQAVYSD